MAAVEETEVQAAAVPRGGKVSQDREGAADNRSPVSVVPVEEDSPAASLSRVNADRADNRFRAAAADFPEAAGASPEADKGSPAEAASPEADKGSRLAAGRDSRANAAFLEVKDSGVVIVGISGVAIADIIAAAIAEVDIMASPIAPTDTAMDTTPVTATTVGTMAGPIATPTATMINGAIGIPTLSALTILMPTVTATS
jgi:hypothetical protein